MRSGKQRSTCLKPWQEMHRRLWPGFVVPELLTPIPQKGGAAATKFFQETTLPTSMMLAFFTFGCNCSKRNPGYRFAAQKFLIDLVSHICSSSGNSFYVKVQALGSRGYVQWPVSRDGHLPVRAFFSDADHVQRFEEQWALMQQDSWVGS